MRASLRSLALAWLMLVSVMVPLAGTEAQSPAPPGAAAPPAPAAQPNPTPALSPDKVRAEVEQFVKFLNLLTHGKQEAGQARLVLKTRYEATAKHVLLMPEDEKHIQDVKAQVPQLEAFKLLEPDKQKPILDALESLLVPIEASGGATDPTVILYDAGREYDTRIGNLAAALDPMAGVLDTRQHTAGLNAVVPTLFLPKNSPGGSTAGAGPAAGGPPPPLPDEGGAPAAGGGGAAAAPAPEAPQLPPCSDARERVTAARKSTTSALKPIDSLISAGNRALQNRYFTLSRDALEKAAERLVELEREWRDIAESLKPPAYSTQDLLDANCTDVLTTALTNAIALNDILSRLYPKLGEVYTELGQHEQAAREISKSVAINPNHANTWAALGNAFLRSDQADEAIKAYLRSVELDTYVPDVWLGLAKAYSRKKENQIAIHYIRRAVSKGYVKFEKLAADPDFASLQGISEFDDLVYLVPGAQPFPR
jgi:Flp pilus assembly protein TadD